MRKILNSRFNKYIITLLVSSIFLVSCSRVKEKDLYRKSAILMDTLVTITVVSGSPKRANAAIDAAFAEILRLQKLISFWDPKSEISEIGREAGIRPVKVSPETMDVMKKAIYISRETNGAFDGTLARVIRLWNIPYSKKIPSKAALRKAMELVGYKLIKIDPKKSTVYLSKKGMSFDTGGLAEGLASDYAEAVLKAHGIKAGLISCAGDITAFGRKPDGHGWRVGIENPRPKGKNDKLLGSVELINEGISTSGDYERYFIINGVRYCHIINARTGFPAQGYESVTVIAPNGTWADGFGCGIFAAGPKKGPTIAKKLGFGLITVTDDGVLHIYGRGLKKELYRSRKIDSMAF